MAPWDELLYFKTTLSGVQSFAPGNVAAINQPDPQCVLLQIEFSSNSSGGTPIVWLDNTVSASKGVVLTSSRDGLILDYRTYGPLCTMQWYGTVWAGAGATVSWIQVSLARWPTGGGDGGRQSPPDNQLKQLISVLSDRLMRLEKQQRSLYDAIIRTARLTDTP